MLVHGNMVLLPEGLRGSLQCGDVFYNKIPIVIARPTPGDKVPAVGVVDHPYRLYFAGGSPLMGICVVHPENGIRGYGALNFSEEISGLCWWAGIQNPNPVDQGFCLLLVAGTKNGPDFI